VVVATSQVRTTRTRVRSAGGPGPRETLEPRRRRGRHPFLYCLHGPSGLATLVEGDHLLGRGHESAIYLDASTVSRRHARLQLARGHGILEDLGSRHGTFVRGERLIGPRRLDDGDAFSLGSVVPTLRVLRAHDPVDTG
jgi:hypothetical protein